MLLILASITLSFIIGDNGILHRTKQASIQYSKASLKEELQLKIADIEMEKLAKGEQLKHEDLQELAKIGAIILDTGIPTLGEYNGYEFEIDENFEVTIGNSLEGVKPTGSAQVITTSYVIQGETVEIKVTASTQDGSITNIEASNGAILKDTISTTEKLFEVTSNGTYYFEITGSNGTKTILSAEVNSILENPEICIKDVTNQGFTIVVDTSYPEEWMTDYQYYLNGSLIQSRTNQKEYIVTGLEDETTYSNIYVTAFYPGNSTGLESNKLSVTTGDPVEVAWTNQTGTNQTINQDPSSYQNPKIPEGFAAIQTDTAKWNLSGGIQKDWNKGLVMKHVLDGNEFVWVPIDGVNVTYKKWCTDRI